MHILITDILRCPRCGPEFGLILLARRVESRRVLEGELGCPNCRLRYPVVEGFADLRVPFGGPSPPEEAPLEPGTPDDALGLAALLGVAEGPGYIVLVGPQARFAPALTATIAGIEVVAVEARLRAWPETPGVTRIAAAPGLPLHSGALRAIALSGPDADRFVEEAVRTVAPLGRVVVLDAPPHARDALAAARLERVFEADGILAARRTF
ncbi:MAG: Trm112 family protein [Gemmatimonadetes bacterium]|nr:Trm112 family protein [Gemmatimonadota bacterium]